MDAAVAAAAAQVPDQQQQDDLGDTGDEEEHTFHSIEMLQTNGISMADITKLKEAGVTTIRTLQCTMQKDLVKIKGVTEARVEKMKAAAAKVSATGTFITSRTELNRRERQCYTISTGSNELNKLLGGGMEAQAITEMHGEWRTGKTQICHTMCITAQIPVPETGYPGGRVIYIDTEGTFRPDRLATICARFDVDQEAALENIFFVRALNSEHQKELLDTMAGLLVEQGGCVKLVIVDSIMALYRTDYVGRGELAARQGALGQFLKRLNQLATEFNFAAVCTNQMTSDPSGGMTFVSDPKKPIGGHVLAHAVQTRVALRKGSGADRIAKLVDSTTLPEGDATFTLTEGGVADSG